MLQTAVVQTFTRERSWPEWLVRLGPYLGASSIAALVGLAASALDAPFRDVVVSAFTPAVFAASLVSAIQLAAAVAGRGRGLPGVLRPVPLRAAAFVACTAVTCSTLRAAPLHVAVAALVLLVWQVTSLRALSIAAVLTYVASRSVALYSVLGDPPRPGFAASCGNCAPYLMPTEGPTVTLLFVEIVAVGVVAFALGWRGLRDRLGRMGVTPVVPIEIALVPVALATLEARMRAWLGAGRPLEPPLDPAAIAGIALATAAALVYLGTVTRRRPTAPAGTPPGPPSPPS